MAENIVNDPMLTVSSSPHAEGRATSFRVMLDVIIALIPALVASVVIFGFRALILEIVCVASCVLSEYVSRRIMKKSLSIGDLSAVVTGFLLAFNLPVTTPVWMAVVGSFAAIVVAKQLFGGIGQNFVNPAIAGRIILLVSFPTAMSSFVSPFWYKTGDAVSSATTLATLGAKGGCDASALPSLSDMFFGLRGGSLGETCVLALLIGAAYLMIRRVISPVIPLCFIGSSALIMLFAGGFDGTFTLYEVMSGGLILGAFFMATDYTTSPVSTLGKVIFGIGCGVITCVIRLFGSLNEGVSYSILIMNILTPSIDALTARKPFGYVRKKKEKEANKA